MQIDPNVVSTVDCVVFDDMNALLLIRRGTPPFEGMYALPGGRVDAGETTEHAVLRELKEETGVEGVLRKLVGVYREPGRDPRGTYVSTAYLVEFPKGAIVQAGDDAASAGFVSDWETLDFAFDHKKIILDALKLKTM